MRVIVVHRAVVFGVLFLLAHGISRADVIDVEGTVHAVDASARTLTVERTTPKGPKTLELEVTKKAGDLSVLKVGDRISLSYDPNLEIVTKFGKDADSVAVEKACQIRIAISDTGEVSVEVKPAEIPPSPLRNEKEPLGGGAWRITRCFATSKDLDFFRSTFGNPVHVDVEPEAKRLVLAPRKDKGLENSVANIVFPLRIRVPFEVELLVSTTAKEGGPFLQMYALPRALDMERPVFNFRTKSALAEEVIFDAWSSKMGVKQGTHMVEETRFTPNKPWTRRFRLPVPNMKSDDFYTLTIGSLGPPQDKTYLHQLIVKGTPVPILGLGLDQKGDVVFIAKVVPKTVAATAGAKEGDVLLAINGKKPTSMTNAVEMMAETAFGESCTVNLKRGEEDMKVVLKPDWTEYE